MLQLEGAETPDAGTRTSVWRNPGRWLSDFRLSRGFWIFFTAAFFFDFGFAVYFFLFNLYLLDCRLDERAMGLIGGALTLGSVVGTLPAGLITKRIGLRPVFIVCFVAAPILGAARAMAVWEPAQIGLAFLAGIAMCLWGVCFLPAIARLTTEHNRAAAFSLIFSVSIGTSALGGVLCGFLPKWIASAGLVMAQAEVKRLILMVSCAIAVVGLCPVLLLRLPVRVDDEPVAEDGIKGSLKSWGRAWRMHPFLLRFLPAMAIWSAVLASFTPFASVYLSHDLHLPLTSVALIYSAAQMVQFCMGLLSPWVFRKLGLLNGIIATQVATALAIGCLAATMDVRLAVAMYLSISATQWMSSPGLYNLLMSKTPDADRSTAAAMTMFSNALLQSVATAGAGILIARYGYSPVLFGIGVVALLSALIFKMFVEPATRVAQAQG